MKKYVFVIVALCLSLLPSGCGRQASKTNSYKIAVIPKGTTHEFWKSIHAGADKAVQDFAAQGVSVEVIWKGPLREDDREQQTQVVEGFISQGVNGIVLAPLDDRALVRPVEEAARANIPTVIIDSGLQSEQIVSFVATDNRKGGTLAAERMGQLLGGKGKVIMLRYAEGSASTHDREEGFLEGMKKFPNIELISTDQYSGATRDTAKRASENLLQRFTDVQGIFCPNESSAAGMLLALQDINKAGKVFFVGFDSSPTFVEALKNKQMHGTILQDPFKMGELGVKTLIDKLTGKGVEKRVDTGVMMVTPENMNDADAARLLHPLQK